MKLFANAQPIQAPATKAKGKGKTEFTVPGLREFAIAKAVVKAIESVCKTFETQVKGAAMDEFVKIAHATAKRPDSLRGVDGNASGSLELRKRSSNSPLSDAERALLDEHKVPVEKKVSVPKMYGINPKYDQDVDLMAKVEAALVAAGVPTDLIVLQEEKYTYTVSDETIEAVFAAKAPREVIEVVTTQAVKPVTKDLDLAEALTFVKDLLMPEAKDVAVVVGRVGDKVAV